MNEASENVTVSKHKILKKKFEEDPGLLEVIFSSCESRTDLITFLMEASE